jgi:hypothetical protein
VKSAAAAAAQQALASFEEAAHGLAHILWDLVPGDADPYGAAWDFAINAEGVTDHAVIDLRDAVEGLIAQSRGRVTNSHVTI